MANCACGSGSSYDQCCGLYISGKRPAPTAEALMRARYTAYATGNIDFIEKTHAPGTDEEFDRAAAEKWSATAKWQGLEVVSTEGGREGDNSGTVEFIAKFQVDGKDYTHHEKALFKVTDGTWYFVDGKHIAKPFVRTEPKVGRNDPCPCGSGKKAKKCCGAN